MNKFKVGDVILIPQKEKNCLGECFNFEVNFPYIIEEMNGKFITMLSGHTCTLTSERDFILYNQILNYEIY